MENEPNDTMIFVVGNARSGTTMMGRILGNHPSVHTFRYELHFFDKLWPLEKKNLKLSFSAALDLAARLTCIQKDGYFNQGDPRRFEKKARFIIQSIHEDVYYSDVIYKALVKYVSAENGKTISCEQTPGYVYYIPEIIDRFLGAKIITIMRDPRDIILSQKKRWRRFLAKQNRSLYLTIRTRMNYHPITTSKLWNTAINSVYNFNGNKNVYFVKFEDVLKNPEKEIQEICKFLGISYYKSMLEVPMIGSSLISDRPEEKGIDRKRTSNWQKGGLNSAEIFICQMITDRNMKRLGYKHVKIFPNPIALIFYAITFPVKLFFAFFIQYKKDIKNINEFVKKRL